jgi:multidrug transporter EmrE-like cation transporter
MSVSLLARIIFLLVNALVSVFRNFCYSLSCGVGRCCAFVICVELTLYLSLKHLDLAMSGIRIESGYTWLSGVKSAALMCFHIFFQTGTGRFLGLEDFLLDLLANVLFICLDFFCRHEIHLDQGKAIMVGRHDCAFGSYGETGVA